MEADRGRTQSAPLCVNNWEEILTKARARKARCEVFIASSSENLPVAYAIHTHLEDFAEPTVWKQAPPRPGETAIEKLLADLDRYDFAVAVFGADDVTISRGRKRSSPRDNVVFELGLFMGRLGRLRSFLLAPNEGVKILSDLEGLQRLSYDSRRRNPNSAVLTACQEIRNAVKRLGPRKRPERHHVISDLERSRGKPTRARVRNAERLPKQVVPDGPRIQAKLSAPPKQRKPER